jgi:gluconolactonase
MEFEVLSDRVGFCEGPVFSRDGSIIITSLSDGCLYRTENGTTKEFVMLGGGPNGAVEAADARLYIAQSGGVFLTKPNVPSAKPSVQVVSPDGNVTALQDGPVAPNDLAFGPDGYLYVTDPTRGPERTDGRLWRYDVNSGEGEQLTHMDWYCNGIAFSTETDCFYVADTKNGRILRFRMDAPTTDKAEVFIQMERNVPDGFAFDIEGNLICATVAESEGGAGCLQVWSKDGKLIDVIETSGLQYVTNVAIDANGTMVVTDASAGRLLKGKWHCAGLPLVPFR